MEMSDLDASIEVITRWLGTGSINIFGLPFSGKDTHGKELSKFFNAPLIGGGDIIRSELGPQALKDHIADGSLAPSGDYLALVLPYLSQDMFTNHPLILSSVGRWHGEEESIMQAAAASGHPIKAVLYLNVSNEEAHRRWQLAERGRADDATEHILENRFTEFQQKTLPVIEFYREQGLLIEIDGMPPERTVTHDIIEQLYKAATA